jgi:hypothetical protein
MGGDRFGIVREAERSARGRSRCRCRAADSLHRVAGSPFRRRPAAGPPVEPALRTAERLPDRGEFGVEAGQPLVAVEAASSGSPIAWLCSIRRWRRPARASGVVSGSASRSWRHRRWSSGSGSARSASSASRPPSAPGRRGPGRAGSSTKRKVRSGRGGVGRAVLPGSPPCGRRNRRRSTGSAPGRAATCARAALP